MEIIDVLEELRKKLKRIKNNKQFLNESLRKNIKYIESFNTGVDCCIDEIDDYIEKLDKKEQDNDSSGWDFHWDGRGDYREAERCFYGDFS